MIGKLISYIGLLFMINSPITLLLYNTVLIHYPDESFPRDVLGFPVPISESLNIPGINFIYTFIQRLISIHGAIAFILAGTLFVIGSALVNYIENNELL